MNSRRLMVFVLTPRAPKLSISLARTVLSTTAKQAG
jgi:hypothetical protein